MNDVLYVWPPYVLLAIVGHCLLQSAYGDGGGWFRFVVYFVWCVCAWWTVRRVTDYMQLRIQADNRRWIP